MQRKISISSSEGENFRFARTREPGDTASWHVVNEGEAVIVAVETDGGFRERSVLDYGENVQRAQGIFKGKNHDKCVVEILSNFTNTMGTMYLGEDALGIPVEAEIQSEDGRAIVVYGFMLWKADFKAEQIDVYSYVDDEIRSAFAADIRRIISWHECDQAET